MLVLGSVTHNYNKQLVFKTSRKKLPVVFQIDPQLSFKIHKIHIIYIYRYRYDTVYIYIYLEPN